jgi:protein-disulfide isomerase-like protein with CxxC motif
LPCAFESREVSKVLGVESLPTLIVLDKSGRVRLIHNGYDASEHLARNLSREIENLLREPS